MFSPQQNIVREQHEQKIKSESKHIIKFADDMTVVNNDGLSYREQGEQLVNDNILVLNVE